MIERRLTEAPHIMAELPDAADPARKVGIRCICGWREVFDATGLTSAQIGRRVWRLLMPHLAHGGN